MRHLASKANATTAETPKRRKRNKMFTLVPVAVFATAFGGHDRRFVVDAFETGPTLEHKTIRSKTTKNSWKQNGGLCLSSQSTIGGSLCGMTGIRMTPSVPFQTPAPFSLCTLHASPQMDDENRNEIENNSNPNPIQKFAEAVGKRLQMAAIPSLTVVWWPLFAAMGIPALVSYARTFPPNSSEQFAAVTLLIVANRVYLYALGLTIVAMASLRGAGDPKELGQRLTALTEELLVLDKPLALATEAKTGEIEDTGDNAMLSAAAATLEPEEKMMIEPEKPSFVKKMIDDSGLEENLDGVDAGTQALVLPALVAGLLAVSVVTLPIWSSLTEGLLFSSQDGSAFENPEWINQLQAALSGILPFFSQAWNAILLTLFVRAEFRRLGYEILGIGGPPLTTTATSIEQDTNTVSNIQIYIECLLAVTVTGIGAYYLQYWPAQNFVNSAIAILVARAIRLDSFNAVAGALALLTIYDGVSVLLIPGVANAAASMADVATAPASLDGIASTSTILGAASSNPAASSAMGSVAIQKLTSGGFQPGLLVTKLDGDKLTGTLGLGDAVFPSILASFLKRFDEDWNNTHESSSRLFEASMGGYVIGCLVCELVPSIATRGLPALVFLVPCMGLATFLAASQDDRFEELRRFNND